MKMMPIKYHQRYNNRMSDGEISSGFEAFRNANGEFISEREVEIEPAIGKYGAYFTVRFYDIIDGQRKQNNAFVIYNAHHPNCTRDNYPKDREYFIIPTHEQSELMYALATGDLRGDYAERIIGRLYVDLVVLNPKSGLAEFLPEIFEFHTKAYKDYGWERQSK